MASPKADTGWGPAGFAGMPPHEFIVLSGHPGVCGAEPSTVPAGFAVCGRPRENAVHVVAAGTRADGPSAVQLRIWLDGLSVIRLRELAMDMHDRWESRRAELVDFLEAYRPSTVLRAYAEAHPQVLCETCGEPVLEMEGRSGKRSVHAGELVRLGSGQTGRKYDHHPTISGGGELER